MVSRWFQQHNLTSICNFCHISKNVHISHINIKIFTYCRLAVKNIQHYFDCLENQIIRKAMNDQFWWSSQWCQKLFEIRFTFFYVPLLIHETFRNLVKSSENMYATWKQIFTNMFDTEKMQYSKMTSKNIYAFPAARNLNIWMFAWKQ